MRSSLVLALTGVLLAMGIGPASASGGWTGIWAFAPQQPVEFEGLPTGSVDGFDSQIVRQVVRVSAGGTAVRVRLSNVYGPVPIRVAGASIARSGDGASVEPGSLRPLTFRLRSSAVAPVGRSLVSDLVVLPVAAFSSLTVSFYYLTGIEAIGRVPCASVVTFGDSMTEGAFSTPDANNRYPGELAERLGGRLGVLNAGIRAAHARGVRIIGGTTAPYKGNPYGLFTERGEVIRDAVNHWIRTGGEYDAVGDFERALADPDNPAFDAGDKVHPNDAGYHAMAAAVPLHVL